jgi:hypothetical protein
MHHIGTSKVTKLSVKASVRSMKRDHLDNPLVKTLKLLIVFGAIAVPAQRCLALHRHC